MTVPCHNDNRFIHDKAAVMREAAPLCFDCPLFTACWESHKGEEAGVVAGTLPTDEVRIRARAAGKSKETCRNGHPFELYGTNVDNLSPLHNNTPLTGCNRCADITRYMVRFDPENPTPIPDTVPHTVRPSRRGHGSDAGYRAHKRRGEDACQPCLDAHNAYNREHEQARAVVA
jgi:hypothetical protein